MKTKFCLPRCARARIAVPTPPRTVRREIIADSIVMPLEVRLSDHPSMQSGLFVALFAVAGNAYALNNPIRTEAGLLRGSIGEVSVFRGIPYAAPPIGNLRWKPPRTPQHWKGVLDATNFGSICMQAPSMFRDPSLPMSEDCLTLNIW